MTVAVGYLSLALQDRSPRRRRRSAEALAADGSPRAVYALAHALAKECDKTVGTIAGRALGALGDQAAIDEVCRLWEKTNSPVLGDFVAGRA